ncbi:MAG: MarP family serine protease, partial [Frankia sp.]|nr:MarP family serine protease [Frankia sp.]
TLGAALRRRVTVQPLRLADSAAGAGVSVVSVLVVAWLLGTAVAQSPFVGLARQAKHSRVLQTVDRVMPPAPALLSDFRDLLDQRGFPQVFADLRPEPGAPVAPPDPRLANSPAVQRARPRVVKVVGTARSCSRRSEGSGFVYATQHVMTNAHVVAGVRNPSVITESGDRLDARVVLYVEDLAVAPLAFDGSAKKGDSAIVVGYPGGGPFQPRAARVRDEITAVGRDIYQRHVVRRSVYSLNAVVQPGNSGGPLLAPDARIYGVVFAAAADDRNTGYALTADEVAGDARRGARATASVSTQACD